MPTRLLVNAGPPAEDGIGMDGPFLLNWSSYKDSARSEGHWEWGS